MLKKADLWVILGGIGIAALAGIWVQAIIGPEIAAGSYTTSQAVGIIDNIIDFFTIISTLLALGMVYRAKNILGGKLERGLEVIGIGLLLFTLTFWPSYRWSISGSPEWFGLTTGAWSLFFSTMTLVTFSFIAYGFYLIWRLGRE